MPADRPTRRFAVLGDPIAHSRSPAMHAAAFRALGLPHNYEAVQASPAELAPTIRRLVDAGISGFNVTVPHKRSVARLVDRCTQDAVFVGAVNTVEVVREGSSATLVGHATDGPGFLDALAELDPLDLRRAVVLGGGGAGACIVWALSHAFPQLELHWVTREPAAVSAPANVRAEDWDAISLQGVDLLVNATTVGMRDGPAGFPHVLELSPMREGGAVIDIVYPRPPGGLLDAAEGLGLRVQDGRAMLVHQGARALEIWLREPVPKSIRSTMFEAISGR